MPDLVGTCPKDFWLDWIGEGDPAGTHWSGETWAWFTKDRLARTVRPGDRFYVVAHGKLRGWAPVVELRTIGPRYAICRQGNAVACTIPSPIPGFRGLRVRWWDRALEVDFKDWKTP